MSDPVFFDSREAAENFLATEWKELSCPLMGGKGCLPSCRCFHFGFIVPAGSPDHPSPKPGQVYGHPSRCSAFAIVGPLD